MLKADKAVFSFETKGEGANLQAAEAKAKSNVEELFKDMPSIGPQALPGFIVASCRMTGPAYRRWGSVCMRGLFAPDTLLGELRDRDRTQWDNDLSTIGWFSSFQRKYGMGC